MTTGRITILFLSADPFANLNTNDEFRRVHEALQDRPEFKLFSEDHVYAGNLQHILHETAPHVVHFSGHGLENRGDLVTQHPAGGQQVMPLDALADMLEVLKGRIPTRMVVLNACWSLERAEQLRKVVDAVVGMTHSIADRSASAFAEGFYLDLSRHGNLSTALGAGRAQIKALGLPDSLVPKYLLRDGLTPEQVTLEVDSPEPLLIQGSLREQPVPHAGEEALPKPRVTMSKTEMRVKFSQINVVLRNYPSRIGGTYAIPRPEADHISQWIDQSEASQRLAILLDKAGSGKTVVMSQVLQDLEGRNRTVLAIKSDTDLSGIETLSNVQDRLGLPASIPECVRVLASDEQVVVLIDQLDALSAALSQNFSTLDIVYRMILELVEIENVRVIVSCREFDLNFDPLLSNLKRQRYQAFALVPFTRDQVEAALQAIGVQSPQSLSERMHRFLSLPLHLNLYAELFAQGVLDAFSEEFFSLHQLYDQLWQVQITAVELPHLQDAINALVAAMNDRQRLIAPVGALDRDEYTLAVRHLQRVNFIRREKHNYVFQHQTLFDYCYARRFVAEGHSISQALFTSSQGLFERAQLIQVLAYLRGSDPQIFISEVESLLFSGQLRVHLRILLVEWLASLREPTHEEHILVKRLLSDEMQQDRFLLAAQGNVGWFDFLNDGFVGSLLHQGDHSRVSNAALIYLASMISCRRAEILGLLAPFQGQDVEWDRILLYCLARLDSWDDKVSERHQPLAMFCHILSRVHQATTEMERCFEQLVASYPAGGCQALRIHLDRRLDNVLQQQLDQTSGEQPSLDFAETFALHQEIGAFLNDYPTSSIIAQAAFRDPGSFVTFLLDWFIRVCTSSTHLSDSRYPSDAFLYRGPHGYPSPSSIAEPKDTNFIEALIGAMRQIAVADSGAFRPIAHRLAGVVSESAQGVLAQVYLAVSDQYANDIAAFLLQDERRLFLGGNNYLSCQLLAAAFSFWTIETRAEVENKILSLRPPREVEARQLGLTQILFLKSLPRSLLNPKTFLRMQELERKFPGVEPRPLPETTFFTVGSPISPDSVDKMSDDGLLSAMRSYDETTDWDAPRSEKRQRDISKGGIVEFSRLIAERSKAQPDRFYRLTFRFDASIPLPYVSAILSGLAGSNAPGDHVFELARRFAPRFAGEGRIGFCRSLEMRASEVVPDDLLEVMTEWALNDPDPGSAAENELSTGILGEWLSRGINSVRGVAVEAVCRCSSGGTPTRTRRAVMLLEKAVHDPSSAVAACVLHNLLPLLNNEDSLAEALDLCDQVLAQHPLLLDDVFTYDFLGWASFHYFARFGRYIEMMLDSEPDRVREVGARLACQAALANDDAQPLQVRCLTGDPPLRRGTARAYSQALRYPRWRSTSDTFLRELMQDSDDEVRRNVANCFAHLKPGDLDTLRSFIDRFLKSPSFTTEPEYLIAYVRSVSTYEHELALAATESVVEALENGKLAPYRDDDIVSLPLAVYNRSRDQNTKDRAIWLFERLLQLGLRGARKAIEQWDEHRDWNKLA